MQKQVLVLAAVLAAASFGTPAASHPSGPYLEIIVSEQGNAGDWYFFYQPFKVPRAEVTYFMDVEVTAHGDGSGPVGLLTTHVAPVYDWDHQEGAEIGRFHSPFDLNGPLHMDRDGGPVTFSTYLGLNLTVGGGNLTGVFFIVGSNVPWTAELELQIEDEQDNALPLFESRGSGTLLVPGGEYASGALVNGAAADVLTLDATIGSRGWSHLQYEYNGVQPLGVRFFEAAFPNGYEPAVVGKMYGFDVLGVPFASSTGWVDYAGTVFGIAGDFSSRLAYAQAQTALEASFIHLPMDSGDVPVHIQHGDYQGANRPFHWHENGFPLA